MPTPSSTPVTAPTTWTPPVPTLDDCLRSAEYHVAEDTYVVTVSECGGLGGQNLRKALDSEASRAGYEWHGDLEWTS